MPTIRDLVEEWIEMRALLKRQLEMMKSGQMHAGNKVSDTTTQAGIIHLETCIAELNSLLKDFAHTQEP